MSGTRYPNQHVHINEPCQTQSSTSLIGRLFSVFDTCRAPRRVQVPSAAVATTQAQQPYYQNANINGAYFSSNYGGVSSGSACVSAPHEGPYYGNGQNGNRYVSYQNPANAHVAISQNTAQVTQDYGLGVKR